MPAILTVVEMAAAAILRQDGDVHTVLYARRSDDVIFENFNDTGWRELPRVPGTEPSPAEVAHIEELERRDLRTEGSTKLEPRPLIGG